MRRERKIIRLQEFDYRQNGAYAITICVHERRLAFGRVENGVMRLNAFGLIAQSEWIDIANHYSQVVLDEFIVMPDHFHAIFTLPEMRPDEEPRVSIPDVMRRLKSFTATLYRRKWQSGEWEQLESGLWQRSYHDRILRNSAEWESARRYIDENPTRWLA